MATVPTSTTTTTTINMTPAQNGVMNTEPSNTSETIVTNGGNGSSSANSPADLASFASELTRINGHQQEQELFLQAFEKPTQIYRFLRNRHLTSPIFLPRSLSYMKERMSRSNKSRNNFKINNILASLIAKQKKHNLRNKFLNVVFNGVVNETHNCNNLPSSLSYFSIPSAPLWNFGDPITVEAVLCKITKSKRKDSTSEFKEIWKDQVNILYGPQESDQMLSSISIPAESMNTLDDQHTIYKLLFRIHIQALQRDDGNVNKTSTSVITATLNNDINASLFTKRLRYATPKFYGCELIIYDKNSGCIPEGDYDTALRELNCNTIKSFSPKKRNWETLTNHYVPISMNVDQFDKLPTLKFRLIWSNAELPRFLDMNNLKTYASFIDNKTSIQTSDQNNYQGHNNIAYKSNVHIKDMINNNNNNKITDNNTGKLLLKNTEEYINNSLAICSNNLKNNTSTTSITAKNKLVLSINSKREKIQILYNFLYSNNTRQQTEYTQEMSCPWCGIDCIRLYSLLKHLKLCHGRFNFTYQPAASNGARIDVTINDAYDGSYAGSPYDLAGSSGCSFARTCGPVRRTSVTNLLVCRPRRQKTCLDEFLVLDEDDLTNQRPYITGHNRLYHHTETCLPVHPKELDIDSEGESDPLWLRQKTIQMIDEFTDVNEGEKELMKLWNLHVMKHGFVGDCQLPIACEMFLDTNGHDIVRRNIYRNFILHMCSLFDYGLVSPETVYKIVQKLQSIISKYGEGQEMMSKQREAQLKYWLEVGIHKQDEQKLKAPQKNLFESSTMATSGNDMKLNVTGTAVNKIGKVSGGTATTASQPSPSTSNTMQPPLKRSNTTLKRSCSPHLTAKNNKVINLNSHKNVVRKSAVRHTVNNEDNEVISTKRNGFKRLPATEKDKKSQVNTNKSVNTRTNMTKRRYSMKNADQPPSKRRCIRNNAAANKNNNSNTANNVKTKNTNILKNSTATSRNTKANSNNKSPNSCLNDGELNSSWTSRRIRTRHQRVNCLSVTSSSSSSTNSGYTRSTTDRSRSNNSNANNSTYNMNGTGSSTNSGNVTVSNKPTVHTMRTRLSVPLNNSSSTNSSNYNKTEKR